MIEQEKRKVGLEAFFNIAKAWGLTAAEELKILGQEDPAIVEAWRAGEGPPVARDTVERVSYVLGIFRAINTLLPIPERADAWVRKPNKAPIFGGRSALDRMTAGNVSDLYVVRQYLDAEAPPLDEHSKRLFGALKGQIEVPDDFDATPEDVTRTMEGR